MRIDGKNSLDSRAAGSVTTMKIYHRRLVLGNFCHGTPGLKVAHQFTDQGCGFVNRDLNVLFRRLDEIEHPFQSGETLADEETSKS